MATYTATAKRNQGRQSFVIEFRHPLITDNNGKKGRKARKGLGTTDEQEAKELENQLNQLLSDESWHSIASESRAKEKFDSRIVEIFYRDICPSPSIPQELREKYLPLPKEDYKSVLLMGVSGAGKTTLLRQLMGTDPKKESFPATSINRTTTCETEVITSTDVEYQAVVTFLTEHETRFEIEEALSSAAERAIESIDEQRIAQKLLESKDMRFRLKYLLGGWISKENEDEDDPFSDDESQETLDEDESEDISEENREAYFHFLQEIVARVKNLAAEQRKKVEAELEISLMSSSASDRDALLETILDEIKQSKELADITDDILEDVKEKFLLIKNGDFEKNTTGWIRAWRYSSQDRQDFITTVKQFSGIHYKFWGRLITPLVNGIRIQGAFFPEFLDEKYSLVLIDTEGLFHKGGDSIREQLARRFIEVNSILLVDDATKAMMHTEKALEAVAACGQTQKLCIAFTHMDNVKGDNLKTLTAKKEHIFNGVKNVLGNTVSKNIGREAAHAMREHLETNTFYLGFLDRKEGKGDLPELYKKLGLHSPKKVERRLHKELNINGLELAIQAATQEFRYKWGTLLGIPSYSPKVPPLHWATVKALTRRYAEGWGIGGLDYSPVDGAWESLRNGLSRFLEDALVVEDIEEKNILANQIKEKLYLEIAELVKKRLLVDAQPQWRVAYNYSGRGSTHPRKMEIEGIYDKQIPIPQLPMSKQASDLIADIKVILEKITSSFIDD
jgi:ABC-type lipoprotein export system ATPase subunit